MTTPREMTEARAALRMIREALAQYVPIPSEEALAALDKPRSANSLLMLVNPGGRSTDTIQTLLMQMRDEGVVKFDIKKGLWSRA